MSRFPSIAVTAALCTAAVTTAAQTVPPPSIAHARPADPADHAVAVPAATYRPALSGYRRFADPPAAEWKVANDTVERIGGWRAYAREATAPPPAASGPDTPRTPQR